MLLLRRRFLCSRLNATATTRATLLTDLLHFSTYNYRQSFDNRNHNQEQQDEGIYQQNFNFRDATAPHSSHDRIRGRENQRQQIRGNNDDVYVNSGNPVNQQFTGQNRRLQSESLPDDFDKLFPDDENDNMPRNPRWRMESFQKEQLAGGGIRENAKSGRFFKEDYSQQSVAQRRELDNQVPCGNPIVDSLLDGFAMDKKQDQEPGRDSKQRFADSSSEHVESSPREDADEIFKKMKETGLIPNAVAMLDGLCKDGLVQEAMKLFGLMREKGTIPEVVIYTAVVEGFCRAAKYDDAKGIFKKMQNNAIVPNAFSYTVLVKGLCKGGNLEDAVEYCIEMLESGHSPNATTLVSLVDGFFKAKGAEEAVEIVKRLHEKGFILDDKTVREHLEKKGPFPPEVWEAIFGKKKRYKPF